MGLPAAALPASKDFLRPAFNLWMKLVSAQLMANAQHIMASSPHVGPGTHPLHSFCYAQVTFRLSEAGCS